MSLRLNRICRNIIKGIPNSTIAYSTAVSKVKRKTGQLLIGCKRKQLDHYSSYFYGKLDEVPLASKGWNHSKSKEDFFTIHPIQDVFKDTTFSFEKLGIHANIIETLKKEEYK
ncbi:hypothetical protein JTB14_032138 [Gonioctena quinquepunctata]|nr:hypothetical protein JTB14_032138 [Gonioctena quinquepunctata]